MASLACVPGQLEPRVFNSSQEDLFVLAAVENLGVGDEGGLVDPHLDFGVRLPVVEVEEPGRVFPCAAKRADLTKGFLGGPRTPRSASASSSGRPWPIAASGRDVLHGCVRGDLKRMARREGFEPPTLRFEA